MYKLARHRLDFPLAWCVVCGMILEPMKAVKYMERAERLPMGHLCHIWNMLTSPSKMRLERAHTAARRAAKRVREIIAERGKVWEDANGAIYMSHVFDVDAERKRLQALNR